MKFILRGFQTAAVEELIKMLDSARYGWAHNERLQAVGLTATTGAGKTVIATALIERLLLGSDDGTSPPDPGAIFLWMTDLPQLNAQTRDKIFDASGRLKLSQLPIIENTFKDASLSPGKVYFLNTQKLGAKGDLVKSGPKSGRTYTFWEVVSNTLAIEGRTLYLVIDEAHRGMTEARDQSKINEANSIIQRFIKSYPEKGMSAVPIVFGISATLDRFERLVDNSGRAIDRWLVPPDQVRESGLIKQHTIAEIAMGKQTDAPALLRVAAQTWKDSTEQWAAYHADFASTYGDEPLVVPALIIQVENEDPAATGDRKITKTNLSTVVNILTDVVGPLRDEAFVHSFGTGTDLVIDGRKIRYVEASKITADEDARVVFFKSGLGTGWDCPRAEVMFSFRRAEDTTSIAQMIGRMVRTPLARKIEERPSLNQAHVFLPHYNENTVTKVIAYLNATGGGAIAAGITTPKTLVTLPRQPGSEAVVAAISAIPSYTVPTIRERQDVRRLIDLARSLSKHGLDPDAFRREKDGLAHFLVAKRAALAGKPDFKKATNDQNQTITIARVEWVLFAADAATATTLEIPATEATTALLFGQAKRVLGGDTAVAYCRARIVAEPEAAAAARLEAYYLSGKEDIVRELNAYSTQRIDELLARYAPAITALSLARQQVYDGIRERAADPSLIEVHLPEEIIITRGEDLWKKHLFADENGDLPLPSFKSSWESATLHEELAKPEIVAWFRNPADPNDKSALRIPWRDKNISRPFYPDFLMVRVEGERLLVDILDPHDPTRPDALGKAQGLSEYARKHHLGLGHIDLIAEVKGRLRRLHLEHEATRRAIDGFRNPTELMALFEQA